MTRQPTKLTRDQMAERRNEGVRPLKAGALNQAEISRHLGVTEAAVSKWKKLLDTSGRRPLAARKATGRLPKKSAIEREELGTILKKGALAAGFSTEQWTQARVKQVIQRQFGVEYHRDYISRLLHGMGWSVQKPETRRWSAMKN